MSWWNRSLLAKHWRNTVYSNVWISLCAATFCWQGEAISGFTSHGFLPIFVFFATVFTYNYQRTIKLFRKSTQFIPGRNAWLIKNRTAIIVWVVIGGLGTLFMAFQLPLRDWLILSASGAMSIGYIAKFGWGSKKRIALREFPLIKIFMIAFSWAMMGVMLPFVHHLGWDVLNHKMVWLVFFEKTFFILAITIPFDIRDLEHDASHMKTIPQVFGVDGALKIMTVFLFFSVALVCCLFWHELYSHKLALMLLTSLFFTEWILLKAGLKQKELYYTGWLDSTIFIQSILVLLFAIK